MSSPQLFSFNNYRKAEYVIFFCQLTIIPDGSRAHFLPHKILNLRLRAVKAKDAFACGKEAEPEVPAVPEKAEEKGCHPIGPFKKGKFICVHQTGKCLVACRRKYLTLKNEINQLKCINGKWLTYYSSEIVDYQTIYSNLNYICRLKRKRSKNLYFTNQVEATKNKNN